MCIRDSFRKPYRCPVCDFVRESDPLPAELVRRRPSVVQLVARSFDALKYRIKDDFGPTWLGSAKKSMLDVKTGLASPIFYPVQAEKIG